MVFEQNKLTFEQYLDGVDLLFQLSVGRDDFTNLF